MPERGARVQGNDSNGATTMNHRTIGRPTDFVKQGCRRRLTES
jgi:hypothetical protein